MATTLGKGASITHASRHASGGPDSLATLYAALNGSGQIALSAVPPGAFDLFYVTNNTTTLVQLAIPAGQGAIVRVADDGTAQHNPELAFLPNGADPTKLSSWILTPIDPDGAAAAALAQAQTFAMNADTALRNSLPATFASLDGSNRLAINGSELTSAQVGATVTVTDNGDGTVTFSQVS